MCITCPVFLHLFISVSLGLLLSPPRPRPPHPVSSLPSCCPRRKDSSQASPHTPLTPCLETLRIFGLFLLVTRPPPSPHGPSSADSPPKYRIRKERNREETERYQRERVRNPSSLCLAKSCLLSVFICVYLLTHWRKRRCKVNTDGRRPLLLVGLKIKVKVVKILSCVHMCLSPRILT